MAHRATNSTTVRASLRPSEELAAGVIASKHVHDRKNEWIDTALQIDTGVEPFKKLFTNEKNESHNSY